MSTEEELKMKGGNVSWVEGSKKGDNQWKTENGKDRKKDPAKEGSMEQLQRKARKKRLNLFYRKQPIQLSWFRLRRRWSPDMCSFRCASETLW